MRKRIHMCQFRMVYLPPQFGKAAGRRGQRGNAHVAARTRRLGPGSGYGRQVGAGYFYPVLLAQQSHDN
jgi:hypothetical protein